MIRSLTTAAVALALLAPAAASAAAAGGQVRRDAREQAPPALIGVWKADVAASTFPGAAPREQLRTFQYTAEGKVMVSFLTINAQGEQDAGHWVVQLDGTPGHEYHTRNGAVPLAELKLVQADPYTFNLTNSVGGVVASRGVYKLSEDGRTLTLIRSPGAANQTQVVYRRWGAS
jgi:hypothetical protein